MVLQRLSCTGFAAVEDNVGELNQFLAVRKRFTINRFINFFLKTTEQTIFRIYPFQQLFIGSIANLSICDIVDFIVYCPGKFSHLTSLREIRI